jgi:hypothetical protein
MKYLQICSALIFAALVFPRTVRIAAQNQITSPLSKLTNQNDSILNAPYSARRRFTSVKKLPDGSIERNVTGGSEARDSQGRTYSEGERQWTYMEGTKSVLKSEMLYRVDDPVANTVTKWESVSKEVKVIHFPPKASEKDSSGAQCEAACGTVEASVSPPGEVVESLGIKTIEGVVAEGTRSSYSVSGGRDHNTQTFNVVHERWYCPELKIVVLQTNNDPRGNTYTDELVDIVRGSPDVGRYHLPSDAVVHESWDPQQMGDAQY